MEESEKRKERLRAMRMEAEQAEVCSNVETFPVPNSLSNPLVENSAAQSTQEQPFANSRFGFYTDPMAAFSANKKRGQLDHQITRDYFTPPSFIVSPMPLPSSFTQEPMNSGMTPSPAHQLKGSSSFHQRMYQAQGHYNNGATYGGPRGASPLPMHQGTPETWNGPGGRGYSVPSSASGSGQHFRPGFEPVRSPSLGYVKGRPQWQGGSPRPGSGRGVGPGQSAGRGRGHCYGDNMSPGLGQSRGRGRGFHSSGLGAECFYNRSMDENPWQQLEPGIWKSTSLKSPGNSNSWLPKSISMKKMRTSEASRQSSSQPSLAEYLAASFNEASNK